MEITPFLGFSEPISSISHLLSAVLFLGLGSKMIWLGRGNMGRTTALVIYTFCGIFLFSMSGVYHLLDKGTTSNYVLRILDHAGIYLMISGSFTPFQIIFLRGLKRWLPLIGIWILAITGLTLTSIFFSTMPEWLLLSFFISMGWMSLFTVAFIFPIDRPTVKFIFMGGVLYTLGAIADFARAPIIITQVIEAHEVFHFFVSAAAMVHFYAIYRIATVPISDKLTVIVKLRPHQVKAYFTSENACFFLENDAELKTVVKNWIEKFYPLKLRPKFVRFKYFKEDGLEL